MTSSYFTYDKNKVIQALRYHFISRREIKVMIILVNVFAVLSVTLFFFKQISPLAFLVSSMLWFFLMLMFWIVLPKLVYKKAITFRDRFKATVDSRGFGIENERGAKEWGWNEFSSWMESPHFFHLYFNPRSFFIIPKDAFEGDDVHAARKIISAGINRS